MVSTDCAVGLYSFAASRLGLRRLHSFIAWRLNCSYNFADGLLYKSATGMR
jgi:hypothetical protein